MGEVIYHIRFGFLLLFVGGGERFFYLLKMLYPRLQLPDCWGEAAVQRNRVDDVFDFGARTLMLGVIGAFFGIEKRDFDVVGGRVIDILRHKFFVDFFNRIIEFGADYLFYKYFLVFPYEIVAISRTAKTLVHLECVDGRSVRENIDVGERFARFVGLQNVFYHHRIIYGRREIIHRHKFAVMPLFDYKLVFVDGFDEEVVSIYGDAEEGIVGIVDHLPAVYVQLLRHFLRREIWAHLPCKSATDTVCALSLRHVLVWQIAHRKRHRNI